MKMRTTERQLEKRGKLLDDYMTTSGSVVRLYRLPGTFATLFPDGSVEYHSTDHNWRNDVSWRYGEHLHVA